MFLPIKICKFKKYKEIRIIAGCTTKHHEMGHAIPQGSRKPTP